MQVKFRNQSVSSSAELEAGIGVEIQNQIVSLRNPIIPMTQAEYDALTEEQKMDDTVRLIIDTDVKMGLQDVLSNLDIPIASATDLGVVRVGKDMTIDEEGVLNLKPKEVNWDDVQNKPTDLATTEDIPTSMRWDQITGTQDVLTKSDVTGIMRMCGSVQSYTDLPTDAKPGDTWNVIDEDGVNYTWVQQEGSETGYWDSMGRSFQFRTVTNEQIQSIVDGFTVSGDPAKNTLNAEGLYEYNRLIDEKMKDAAAQNSGPDVIITDVYVPNGKSALGAYTVYTRRYANGWLVDVSQTMDTIWSSGENKYIEIPVTLTTNKTLPDSIFPVSFCSNIHLIGNACYLKSVRSKYFGIFATYAPINPASITTGNVIHYYLYIPKYL